MSITLYRKYRPQKFSEIIGQTHIVQTLSNALLHHHVAHAYLFTGPRGTGKTTLARIFAKALNCQNLKNAEPCLECAACKLIADNRLLDITEIDAASHTGVDNIRELKETVKLPPTSAKYKVYIIDEVHMLSTGAFNALLKTLEEPPAHAIFILATTEIHKVPETIISRCQRFDFVRLSMESIIKKLSTIAKKEGVKIGAGALETIAIAAEGGMRDAESILAQIISLEDKNITEKEVEEILGTSDHKSVEDLARFILEKDAASAITLLGKIAAGGYDIDVFAKALLNYLRQLMLLIISPAVSKKMTFELSPEKITTLTQLATQVELVEIVTLLDYLAESRGKIKSSFIPQLPLELAILKALNNFSTVARPQVPAPPIPKKIIPAAQSIALDSPTSATPLPASINPEPSPDITPDPVEQAGITAPAEDPGIAIDLAIIKDNWHQFLELIRPQNHSLSAILQNCQPIDVAGQQITIVAKYAIHKDKLNDPQSRLTIEGVFDKILNCRVIIKAVTETEAGVRISVNRGQQASNNIPQDAGTQSSLIADALNIFGGKIVQE